MTLGLKIAALPALAAAMAALYLMARPHRMLRRADFILPLVFGVVVFAAVAWSIDRWRARRRKGGRE